MRGLDSGEAIRRMKLLLQQQARLVGIDWGSQTIKVAGLVAAEKPPRGRFAGCFLPAPGPGAAAGTAGAVLGQLLTALCQETGVPCKGARAAVALPSAMVLTRPVYLPRLSRRELRAALYLELERVLPFPVDEAVADYIPLAGRAATAGAGEEQGYLLLAARQEAVTGRAGALRRAGLRPAPVEPEPVTLLRLARLLAPPGGPGCHVLVDLGAAGTRLVILRDGELLLFRDIPVGGAHLTAALAEFLGTDQSEAEARKIADFQTCRDLGAFGAAAERLVSELGRSLRFVERERRLEGYAGLYLVGGGAHWPVLRRVVEETVGLPAREPVLLPLRSLDPVLAQSVALGLWGHSRERGGVSRATPEREAAVSGLPARGGGEPGKESPGQAGSRGAGPGGAHSGGALSGGSADRGRWLRRAAERRESSGDGEPAETPASGPADGTAAQGGLGWGRPLRPFSLYPGGVRVADDQPGDVEQGGGREPGPAGG